jgi:hypothetical protein
MHLPFRHLTFPAVMLAALQSAAAQTTLLSENFNSPTWFNSSTSGIDLDANGKPLANDGKISITAGRHALTYFTTAGSQQSLAQNETLQVAFDLSFSKVGTTSGGFRVGLFDSNGGARPAANGTNNIFQNYDGYIFTWTPNPGTSSNALNLRERQTGSGSSSQLLSTTAASTYSTLTTESNGGASAITGSATGQVFQSGTVYSAAYTVSRGSGNAVTIEFNVNGGGAGWSFGKTYSITSPSTLAFDSFAILSVSTNSASSPPTDGSNFSIDNLRIVYTPAPPTTTAASSGSGSTFSAFDLGGPTVIPEPSTYAACAGTVVLGLALWRRRRAAAHGGSS